MTRAVNVQTSVQLGDGASVNVNRDMETYYALIGGLVVSLNDGQLTVARAGQRDETPLLSVPVWREDKP